MKKRSYYGRRSNVIIINKQVPLYISLSFGTVLSRLGIACILVEIAIREQTNVVLDLWGDSTCSASLSSVPPSSGNKASWTKGQHHFFTTMKTSRKRKYLKRFYMLANHSLPIASLSSSSEFDSRGRGVNSTVLRSERDCAQEASKAPCVL